jgi:hypothetical protein
MQKSIAKESPRRIARRLGAAGVALAAVVTLGACKATGGGYIDEPLPSMVLPPGVEDPYKGEANFGFNFTCEMNGTARRAEIYGQITYHDTGPSTVLTPIGVKKFPEFRIHGIVGPPIFVDGVTTCEEAVERVLGLPVAQFDGTYRPQNSSDRADKGEFPVNVFDQGEPGRTSDPVITGDEFSIQLRGGAYSGYTRGGYIEGGNVQVEH